MNFTSLSFGLFFIILFILYYLIPTTYRKYLLLASNLLFYLAAGPVYTLLLAGVTVLSFVIGIKLEQAESTAVKKRILTIGITLFVLLLGIFKYTNSVFDLLQQFTISGKLALHATTLRLVLPLGISFYTFQTISYLADIYTGKTAAEHNFVNYALFMTFFPQIVSGPIPRADKLLPQFRQPVTFHYENILSGIALVVIGLFKKLVIANTLAEIVDSKFASLQSYVGLVLIVLMLLYAIQIYCDFSGYTDIAIGLARILGIQLSVNFNSPYSARSIKEFWNRWHISLSTWLRDYVYIPLGGNRKGTLRYALNIMITFLVSGIWHGTGIGFLIWGGLHGFYQVTETLLDKTLHRKPVRERNALSQALNHLLTLLLVGFAWIFFRLPNLQDAGYLLGHMFHQISDPIAYFKVCLISLDMTNTQIGLLLFFVVLLGIYDHFAQKIDLPAAFAKAKPLYQFLIAVAVLTVLVIFSNKGVSTTFIYANF